MNLLFKLLWVPVMIIKSRIKQSVNRLEVARLKRIGVLEMREHSYGLVNVKFWDRKTKLRIGKYVSIADGVIFILGGNHRLDWVTTYPFPEKSRKNSAFSKIQGHPSSKGDIIIGNDVWIGQNATILSGVEIENGAVIGAHCLVARNVPSYSICVGNPGKIVGYRFEKSTIDRLNILSWWDWTESELERKAQLLCGEVTAETLQELEML